MLHRFDDHDAFSQRIAESELDYFCRFRGRSQNHRREALSVFHYEAIE